MKQILIISPDANLRAALQHSLAQVQTPGQAMIVGQYPSLGQLGQILKSRRSTTVIVGLGETDRALGLIAELRRNYPGTRVVAAHSFNSPELILGAIRAGASEYLGPPFEVEYLERALQEPAPEKPGPATQGCLMTFLPASAGSGASTAAMHVAGALARESGKKVLLIDFDFHSGVVDFRLRLKPEFTLADAIERVGCLDELWSRLPCRREGIDVLVAPGGVAVQPGNLAQAAAVFASARRVYPYVIADLPPAIYTSCREVLTEAEPIYLVCTPELVSLHLAHRKAEELCYLGVPKKATGLVLNRANDKQSLSAEEVGKIVGIPLTWTLRNDYRAVSNATRKGCLVPENSDLGKQFRNFARHILSLPAAAERSARELNRESHLPRSGEEPTSRSPQQPIKGCSPLPLLSGVGAT